MKKFRERLRNREALAIRADIDIMDILMAEAVIPNEDCDGTIVISIRGPLEHHACGWGDSYEQIAARFDEALASAPLAVVFRIDSPGGVVSGLNETVYAMRKAKRKSGVPVYVYVDEMACSAAYALSCVADEICLPESAVVGSIGVISTMCSQVGADKKAGLEFATITSGARKADGHPHVDISDDAIKVETGRVAQLASAFYKLVARARPISAEDAKSYEAGIFMGEDAVASGIADMVAGWNEFLSIISVAHGGASVPTSVAQPGTSSGVSARKHMLQLKALVAQTKKALAAEKNATKRASLAAQLGHYEATLSAMKKTKYKMEEEETVEDDDKKEEGNDTDRDEESDDGDDKDEDKKEKKASSEEEEEASAESDDDEDKDEDKKEKKASAEDDEEEAIAALTRGLKGKAALSARGTLKSVLSKAKAHDQLLSELKRERAIAARRDRNTLIDSKLAGHYITKSEAAWLKTEQKATVESFLKTRKSPLFHADSEGYVPREDNAPGASHAFTAEQETMFARAAAASKGAITVEKLKANYVAKPQSANGMRKEDVRY